MGPHPVTKRLTVGKSPAGRGAEHRLFGGARLTVLASPSAKGATGPRRRPPTHTQPVEWPTETKAEGPGLIKGGIRVGLKHEPAVAVDATADMQ